jgi:hypothetical protein
MRIPVSLVFTSLFACIPALAGPGGTAGGNELRDADTLVRQLMDESFKTREQASFQLWSMGDAATPALERAAQSDEPEQAFRAREILRKIRLFITPDTDPLVIGMVEKYFKASAEEKTALLSRMMQKRAWRQMLKLYAAETSDEVREKARPMMGGVASRAARESLRNGDPQEALEFLELAPVESSSLLALADFHLAHGTLQDELARARAIEGEKSMIWQLAMCRAVGDTQSAGRIADELGETGVVAAMAALDGDPLPWLETSGKGGLGGMNRRIGGERDPFAEDENHLGLPSKDYTAAAIKRWKLGQAGETSLKALALRSRSRGKQTAATAIYELFVLGEADLAEKSFAKSSPVAAFIHYDLLERIPEALSALGIDPEKADFKTWVEERFKKVGERDIEDQHEVSTESEELLLLANFLERRGLDDEAYQAFAGVMAELEKKDVGQHQDFLRLLFGSRTSQLGAPGLALRLTRDWAGDDGRRWGDAIALAFGEDEDAETWWQWMEELDGKASLADRFEGLLALHSVGGGPGGLREKWIALAWKAVGAAPAADKDVLLKRVLNLGFETGDVVNTVKAWDLLPVDARPENSWVQVMFHLSAVDRWEDCARMLTGQIEALDKLADDQNPALHAYAAAAWRKAGNSEQAEIHDGWVEKLALGDVGTCIQIGHGYAFGMDFERAGKWWFRSSMRAEPGSYEMLQAFKLHSEMILKSAAWDKVASVSEVLAWMYLSGQVQMEAPLPVMRLRLQSDMARAITLLPQHRQSAVSTLKECHRRFSRDGSLADFFFPALRQAGLQNEHDSWFDETWSQISGVLNRYPRSDNTANTAAWLAARAARKLDAAEKLLAGALKVKPTQSAYLDTMAEIQFAKGSREKALEWSRRAMLQMPQDSDLRRQRLRFLSDPFPDR